MKLYLDSVDFNEIERALEFGFIGGLTTTPTFMHRQGIKDIDAAIVKLSGMVPELQVEALGDTVDEIILEAKRIADLPLAKEVVFKVPVSNHGITACKKLRDLGHRVNVHLIYTLNQAYMALEAGASFICPLAGRLQDQGHDVITLYEQCVDVIDNYGYDSQVMFSSVRYPEHVRQALLAGVHVCTMPYSIMSKLCDNSLTQLGADQFKEHTTLITTRVEQVMRKENPTCKENDTLREVMIRMTESGLGAVSVVTNGGELINVFTDGDLRRAMQEHGKEVFTKKLSDLKATTDPLTLECTELLEAAVKLFKDKQVDNIVVVNDGKPVGILDIQDLVKINLITPSYR
jgi:TalC/MipB family fructose-6-phosphate aldolase